MSLAKGGETRAGTDSQHHRIVLADVLLPASHRAPRQRKDQDDGHGVRRYRLSVCHALTRSTDVFPLKDYQGALDKMATRGALKIAVRPQQV